MFVVYDVINRRKAALDYSLLIKLGMWEKTEELIREITYTQLIAVAMEIKETNWCTDTTILALERHVQTVAAHAPHLYARYFQFWLQLKALMVAYGMPIFWITINPADLRCPLIICLADVELELSSDIQSAFQRKTATMNLIAIAKFFHIIYDAIFMSLFGAGQIKGRLLGSILNYFGIVETNGCGMFHLHCLVWLKDISHLVTLQTQLQSNDEFCQKLLSFLEHIIKCSASQNPHLQTLDQACPNANDPITILEFADLLRSDSEAVTRKVQIHSLFHNPTCYKYNTYKSKVYRFDFP